MVMHLEFQGANLGSPAFHQLARPAQKDAGVYLPQPLAFIALCCLVYLMGKFALAVSKPSGGREKGGCGEPLCDSEVGKVASLISPVLRHNVIHV